MGLNNLSESDETESSSDISDSVAYIYIRGGDNADAYHLMSDKHGGTARVRNTLKSLPDYEDQHDFFQQLIVSMDDLFSDGNWAPMLEELGVTAEGLAQYLDRNPEVLEELEETMSSREGDEDAVPAEADD